MYLPRRMPSISDTATLTRLPGAARTAWMICASFIALFVAISPPRGGTIPNARSQCNKMPQNRSGFQPAQVFGESFPDLRVPQAVGDGRLQIAELVAAIVALALELVRVDRLLGEHRLDGVGQLQLAAGAGLQLAQMPEDIARQQIAADHAERRWGGIGLRLLDDPADASQPVLHLVDRDDAVRRRILARNVLDADQRTTDLREPRN